MSGVKKKNIVKKAVLIILSIFLLLFIAAISVFFTIYFSVSLDASAYESDLPTLKIYYDDGVETVDLSILGQKYVTYDELSPYIIDAFVAVEDKRFFSHNGVDYRRLIGATVSNLKSGSIKEGGSTITQQLIKNTELDSRKTLTRKIKEMRLAHQLERKFDKKQIIEKYLNTIYFSNGIYGIASATEQIFGKTPTEVTLSEAAILAGLVKNPQKYSPLNSKENAEVRRNVVLKLMYEQEKISENDYNLAKSDEILTVDRQDVVNGEIAYLNEVLSECAEVLNVSEKELLRSGLSVYTYLDRDLQRYASQFIAENSVIPNCNNGKSAEYAVILADNNSGGVKAVLNSSGASLSEIRRQPGSTIKPFLSYLPAAEYNGYAPSTPVSDVKRVFGSYAPENYKKIYKGDVLLRDAVASSSNSVALELTSQVGFEYCKQLAESFGLKFDEEDNTLSTVLGGMSRGVTFSELLGAYLTLANMGEVKSPHYIKSVKSDTKTLFSDTKPEDGNRVISPESAYLVTEMLKYTVTNGTGSKLSAIAGEVAAKTGTVGINGLNANALCAAYTPEYTVLCSIYSVDNKNENLLAENVTGGSYPANICARMLEKVVKTPSYFDIPDDIVELDIDSTTLKDERTLMLANEYIPETFRQKEIFAAKFAPTELSERGLIPEITDLSFTTTDYGPQIQFSTDSKIRYKIYRQTANESEILLTEITSTDEHMTYIDYDNTESGYVSYRIEAINQFGAIKEYNGSVIVLVRNAPPLQTRFPLWPFR